MKLHGGSFKSGISKVWKKATVLLFVCCSARAEKQPNIIFIYADDWGWGDLSSHGHPYVKTPNLDRLRSEGTDFTQFNVLSPVCSPSRAAVMTGHCPARYSIHQHFDAPALNRQNGMPDWLDPQAVTIPKLLKQAGYRTAHFGKWHLTNAEIQGAPTPDAYGYDEAVVFNGGAGWPLAFRGDEHSAASNAAQFILANKDCPFFVNVWIHESHTPHTPTEGSMEKWKHLGEREQVYAAVITDGDNAVGTVLDAIRMAGVEQNTIVIFSSDNGPESTGLIEQQKKKGRGYGTYYSVGQTGGLRGKKRSLFEGGVRVPFVVRWPGHTPAGRINETTVITAVDLLPTFCAITGTRLPAGYVPDGENILPALTGQAQVRGKPVFWEWRGYDADPDWWPRLAVRDGDWKLVMTYDGRRTELYQLSMDRAESKDVSKEYPEIVSRLSKLVLDWKAALPKEPDASCISKASVPVKIEQKAGAPAPAPAIAPVPTLASPTDAKQTERTQAFERMDKDKDMGLTLDEYIFGMKGKPNLQSRFKNFDKNGDGTLTYQEFVTPGAK